MTFLSAFTTVYRRLLPSIGVYYRLSATFMAVYRCVLLFLDVYGHLYEGVQLWSRQSRSQRSPLTGVAAHGRFSTYTAVYMKECSCEAGTPDLNVVHSPRLPGRKACSAELFWLWVWIIGELFWIHRWIILILSHWRIRSSHRRVPNGCVSNHWVHVDARVCSLTCWEGRRCACTALV
jgi:hypothetical protein